jgi:hypothetical protein
MARPDSPDVPGRMGDRHDRHPVTDHEHSDARRLAEDFDLYAHKARHSADSTDAERWHRCAERAQKIIVAAQALASDTEPGEIAEMMALMSGNPVEVLRRLVVTFGVEQVEDALAEVWEGGRG